MIDPIITKYLLFIYYPYASIFCSGRETPSDQCPELAYSPDRKLSLFLMRKPILQALLELPNRVSCWEVSFTWHLLLRDTSTIHRMGNREDRQLNEKYQLKFVNTFRRIGTHCFLTKWILGVRQTHCIYIYSESVRVKQWNLRNHLMLQQPSSNWLIAAAGNSKERMILRLLPSSVGKCSIPLVTSAMGKELNSIGPTCHVLPIRDLVQLPNFTDGKTKSYYSADVFKFSMLGKEGLRLCSFLNAVLVHANLLQYQKLNIN